MTFEEQALQLAKNAQLIAENNRRACAGIDRFYASFKPGAAPKPSARMHVNSIHDLAQKNPLLMRLLRDLQR